MSGRNVSYTLDGDTFMGRYWMTKDDSGASVSVQFEQHALAARVGTLPEEALARALLGELVRAKVAGECVVGGMAA